MEHKKIRLSDAQIDEILKAFKESFHENDHLWIFGSRVDLQKKGGDIDLYIETELPSSELTRKAQKMFFNKLVFALGDQKIDIVMKQKNAPLQLIHKIAKTEGVQLF